jgi:hypothetical protein
MGTVVSDTGGGDFKRVPAGVHIGRCYRIVDLGTQEETYEGEHKLMRKIALYWELHGEQDDGTPLMQDNGEPMVIWQEYTASLGKKAKLRAMLEAWRGKPFTDEEARGFDVAKLIGAYCMVNVTHKVSGQGKTYAVVSSLTPLPAALRNAKPQPVLPNVVFDLDNFDQAVFDTFHDKLKEKINASIERKGGNRASHAPSRGHADQRIPDADEPAMADIDDDIPFASSSMQFDMQPRLSRRMARYGY